MSGYRLVVGQERLVEGGQVDEEATSKPQPQPQPRLRLQLLSSLCYERLLLGLLCLLLVLAVLCLVCLAVLLPPLLTAAFLPVQQQPQLPSLSPFLLVNSTSTLPTFLSSSYFPSSPHTSLSFPPVLLSDVRGYVAVQYTGTARTWSAVFYSHLLHLICSSPFTVHLYFVIMVLDDSSEHLSVKATLDRYERCMNLDNQSVSIGERVQGWRMQRQSDIDEAHDFDELKRYHNRTGQTLQDNALRQYWAFHEVDRMREEVQQRLDIRYSWVIKQRADALQITDLWSSLYHVSPVWDFVTAASATHQPTPPNSTTHSPDADAASVTTARARRLSSLRLDAQPLLDLSAGLAEADDNPLFLPSYVVGESVFTPRASSAVVNVPECDSWFGHSDQFAAANSDIMSVYYRRGYPPYSSRVAELPTNIVPFNTESYLFLAMRAHNIDSAYVQEHCHRVFRSHHETEQPERQHAHFRPPHRCTESGHNYGLACCKAACEGVNARNNRFVSAVEPLAERSMDSIAHHTRQLLLVATQLAQMGSDSVSATYNSSSSDHRALILLTSEERNTGLAEWTREVERLQAGYAFSASTSSISVSDAERSAPLLPLQADVAAEHSQEGSARWLAELVAADLDSEAVDAQRYQAYAHLTGLALALSRWWQWMEAGGPRLGPPLSLSLPPLARAGYLRYATVVGREADRCESEQQLSKWQALEERHSWCASRTIRTC